MADRKDATAELNPSLTSVADDKPAAPSDAASTQPSSDLKETVEDAPPVTADVEEDSEATTVKKVTNGSSSGSADTKDGENPPSTDTSGKSLKEDVPTGSTQAIQKDGPTEDSSERPRKRMRESKSNIISDMTSQPISSDPVAIRKQVEFYFADSNLPMDQFLFSKVQGHANLPVPIETIASFKRMRHFQPFSAIVDALKESKVLDVVDDDTAVKRKVPLPEDLVHGKSHQEVQKIYEDKTMSRSVYVKGFGDEKPATQFDIEAYFNPHGPINSVRLRRDAYRTFKGSVFVEFDSEETAKAFLALDPKPKWEGKNLVIKSKKQYCDEKVDDINQGRIQPNRNPKRPRHDNRDDERSWKDRRDEDAKRGFDRNDRNFRGHNQRGRGRGREARGGRDGRGGRSGRDDRDGRGRRGGGRQVDNRGVPMVATTTEDSVTEHQPTPDALSTTNGAAAPKGEAHPGATMAQLMTVQVEARTSNEPAADVSKATSGEAATNVEPETPKKRPREADNPSETQTEA
ncbi:hypothetical protein MMC30_002984 [Trapelia coarctata]|nr:hypothetical protein [Trapelia coarctata]